MSEVSSPIVVLGGAGREPINLTIFTDDPGDVVRFRTIDYPGWQRYSATDFSAETFIADLASQIASMVPEAPIRILGISIGGHFGYAAALHLQATGREIAGFCAIDTFMVSSSAPRAGWKGRAAALGLRLLRERRIQDLGNFLRSRLLRACLRLAGDRLPILLRGFASSGRLPILAHDRLFEEELNMRLLIRAVAPWISSLDIKPVALNAPAILIRTPESASDDSAWRRRCPGIQIFEIPGTHQRMFDVENIDTLRKSFVSATYGW